MRTSILFQFELLAAFCSVSRDVVAETLSDIARREFISNQAQHKSSVEYQIEQVIDRLRMTSSVQILSILNLLRVMFRANGLVSGHGTNAWMMAVGKYTQPYSTSYAFGNGSDAKRYQASCLDQNLLIPAAFYEQRLATSPEFRTYWPRDPYDRYPRKIYSKVDGFFGGCYSLDAILGSTLDCLYNAECLRTLLNYFPNLNHVCFP